MAFFAGREFDVGKKPIEEEERDRNDGGNIHNTADDPR